MTLAVCWLFAGVRRVRSAAASVRQADRLAVDDERVPGVVKGDFLVLLRTLIRRFSPSTRTSGLTEAACRGERVCPVGGGKRPARMAKFDETVHVESLPKSRPASGFPSGKRPTRTPAEQPIFWQQKARRAPRQNERGQICKMRTSRETRQGNGKRCSGRAVQEVPSRLRFQPERRGV